MVVGVTLMFWAGWHNLRERRLAMERTHVTLTPANGGEAKAEEGEGLKLRGKAAPGFTLMTMEGKKVSLSDYRGKAVLVNFWATWCAPCKVEMPWFEQLRTQYAGQGFEVLGLVDDVDAGNEQIAKVARKTGVTYPLLLTDGKVQTAYGGLDYLPLSFYVNKDGMVVEETAGLGSKDEIEAKIKETIASGGRAAVDATAAAGGVR
ncbi:MAG: hypothetical protein NVSMB3_09260 [Acidobacteriaceae bacterium]